MRPAVLWVAIALIVGGGALLIFGGSSPLGMADSDFGSLLYTGVLAGVVGAGLLTAFRGQWGRALVSAAIWIAAFVVLVGAYAFGPELRFAGDRILAVLQPGRAVTSGAPGALEVSVDRARDGQFHLDATVNGEPLRFMADTGASVVALDREDAARAGIPTETLRYDTPIRTANGVTRAASVRLDSLVVGGIERRGVPAVVVEERLGVGLLGLSFLDTLSSFEFRGDRMLLRE